MGLYSVYKHTAPNGKVYIGITSRKPEYRWNNGRAISRGKKGRPNGLSGRKGKDCMKSGVLYQIDESTGEVVNIFYGYDEMARKTGYARTPVKETVAGARKRAYGFLWAYEKRGIDNVTV